MAKEWTRVYTLPTKREAQKSASSLKKVSKRPVMIRRIKADAYWRSRGQEWRWAVYRMDFRSYEKGKGKRRAELTVTRKGYTRKDGTRVKASTYEVKDRGKPGKTPKDEQWYEPGVETGWEKDMPEGERRRLVLQAHKGDELSSARAMQALANVTTDRETKQRARADAVYFFGEYKSHPPGIMGRSKQLRRRQAPRITPKTPKLRR